MTKPAEINLSDLFATKAGETPYEFEYVMSDGTGSGIFLQVLGGQSAKVKAEIETLSDERRRRNHAREIRSKTGGRNDVEAFDKTAEDIDFGQKVAACRLVGWRRAGETQGLTPDQLRRFKGIAEEFTYERGLLLCQNNDDVVKQVIAQSDAVENFIKASPKTS